MNPVPGLRVLVIDDERPALDELTYLLERDHRVAEVHATGSPTEALRMLQQLEVDAVFLDIKMPGLTGIELAQVLARFRTPPAAVFVTAHASCCWSSPTSRATRSASTGTSPRWPRSCAPSSVTCCSNRRGSATGSASRCRWLRRCWA